MIPREAGRGRSFKGAGMYYLHDKKALTSERVAFTHTENIPTEDPEKALKWMAWTSINANELKREAGLKVTGHQCKRPVFTFSLAWHPEQRPAQWEMIAAGRQALLAIGLEDHEALMVAHSDRPHAHMHVIANLVNPNTGLTNRVSFSHLKFSKWAEEYELAHGHIYCEQRVENNQKRAEGEYVEYKEPELDLKATITELYFQCDSGKAFRAALAERGLKLAQGKRIVVLDANGNAHSLYRQIEGASSRDIKAKLGDLELPDLDGEGGEHGTNDRPDAHEGEREEPQYFDRDQQNRDWQESIIDASIAAADNRAKTNPKRRKRPVKEPSKESAKGTSPPRPAKLPTPAAINALQDRHLEELGRFYDDNSRSRLALEATLEKQYGANERELRASISHLDGLLRNSGRARKFWLKLRGQLSWNADEDLGAMRLSLENIEMRKSEAQGALETTVRQQRIELEARQARERLEMQPPNDQALQRGDRSASEPDLDEDLGPSLSY